MNREISEEYRGNLWRTKNLYRIKTLPQNRIKEIALWHRQSYIYLCTLMVTKADVQAFMAERPEYTKANRFKDIEVKVYI